MKTRLTILTLLAAALAGCGSSSEKVDTAPDRKLSDRLVDFSKQPPYVNSLDIDPENGEFMLTTNKGFWRIDPESKEVKQVKGTIEAGGKKDTVGTFLEFEVLDDGRLIGSGHPDSQDTLPQFLGFIESADQGASWRVLSRLGEADLHKVVDRHDRLYAFDAVLNGMLISEDGGKTFAERFTPPGLIIDFEVDPEDPEYIVASGEEEVYKTENAGKRWRQLDIATGVRLAWPPNGPLVRAEKDGTVSHSTDRGATWQEVGKVPGEPYKFEYTAEEPDHLFLALSDGTIVESDDRGKSWKEAFRP